MKNETWTVETSDKKKVSFATRAEAVAHAQECRFKGLRVWSLFCNA